MNGSAGTPIGASEGEAGFDLLAASLRASSGDLKAFVEVLADKLEQSLPGRVAVERRPVRRFSKEKRVVRIELTLGDNRYIALAQAGALETRRATAVRGVVLKSEALPLEAWLDALARELAAEANASEESRLALDQLLSG
ncbi:MAG: hypothetical protein ACYDBR_05340 [Gaiellaceae bacterium]